MTGRANEMASAISAAKGVGGGPPCEDRGKEEKTERRGREEAEEIRPRTLLEEKKIFFPRGGVCGGES